MLWLSTKSLPLHDCIYAGKSSSFGYIAALELKPDYLKAVVRRAQANEALEKYEDALEG